MTTIPLSRGRVLDVSGSHGASARIAFYPGESHTVTFNNDRPDTRTFGPFRRDVQFAFEALVGSPAWATRDQVTSALNAGADRIHSARIIATALNEGKKAMALLDKCKALADRSRTIPEKIGARVDAIGARYDALDARGDKVLGGHEDFLAGVESGVAAAEDALNQLTNGAPAE